MSRRELENNNILIRTWYGGLVVFDKKESKSYHIFNNYDKNTNCLIDMALESFNDKTTREQLIADVQTINDKHYHVDLCFEESTVKKIPMKMLNTVEELQQRLQSISDKPVNIRVKAPDGWNTVNQVNIPRILKHSVVKCSGHYTDDYAYDDANNFGRDASSDGCKMSILNDLQGDAGNHSYVKCYWDNKDKEFIIYYGQWLSYRAKPTDSLKLIFK